MEVDPSWVCPHSQLRIPACRCHGVPSWQLYCLQFQPAETLKLLVARYKLRGYKYSNQTFCTNQCPVWTVSIQLQFLYTARYKRIMCCLIPHVWLLDVSFMSAIFCSLPRWVKQVAKNSPSFCGFPGCLDEGNWRSSKPKKHHLPCTQFGCRAGGGMKRHELDSYDLSLVLGFSHYVRSEGLPQRLCR